MDKYEAALAVLLEAIQKTPKGDGAQVDGGQIPIGISNRHIHLSTADLYTLFGPGYALTEMKALSQPGQFACKETLTIVGPKGAIEKVRILGPTRKDTQVEILAADCFKLGIPGMVRMSGDLAGTPGVTLVGPKGSVILGQGAIIAQRHIHMNLAQANALGVYDGQIVSLLVDGPRGGTYANVAIRANDQSALDCHIDMEEANAMHLNAKSTVTILK